MPQTIQYLTEHGKPEDSRAGPVLVAPQPMIIETQVPNERVLFSPKRDANPFFHIAEAIWMLGGRNDAKFLDNFVHDFSERYAEKDGTLHDAYGYRWRHALGFDQLIEVIGRLESNPQDRQCVIQMWDADEQDDLIGKWKSRPCNTNIFLRDNNGRLDLTTCCRSNDMIWGAHGANAVHFSILQEFLASALGLDIGVMYQISNNAHVYIDTMHKLQLNSFLSLNDDRYCKQISASPMFEEPLPDLVYSDIKKFFDHYENNNFEFDDYNNPWFWETLTPMMEAHRLFKQKEYVRALTRAEEIGSMDWRLASFEWIERRVR